MRSWVFGIFFALAGALGILAGASPDGGAPGFLALFLGVGAVITLPLMYGIMGFIGGMIMARSTTSWRVWSAASSSGSIR